MNLKSGVINLGLCVPSEIIIKPYFAAVMKTGNKRQSYNMAVQSNNNKGFWRLCPQQNVALICILTVSRIKSSIMAAINTSSPYIRQRPLLTVVQFLYTLS